MQLGLPIPSSATTQDPESNAERRVDVERLREVIEPLTCAHGVTLVQVEWSGSVLRVIIDGRADGVAGSVDGEGLEPVFSQGGVTLEDCARVSRDVSTALDVADAIGGAYSLEVSSPGADRPLVTGADYRRCVGRLAKCKLIAAAPDGQMVLRGTILGATATSVRIEVDGNEHETLLTNVREAKLVFVIGASPKPNTKQARRQVRRPSAHKPGKSATAARSATSPKSAKPAKPASARQR
ncbi:MAG: ribosome maturation factor RimP [Myxococcales bacterium]|nr:ribosome maturation factor RimP [Myxococcales bacterium]